MINDETIEAYAETHTSPEPGILAKLNRETHLTQVYPQMIAGHLQGTFLRMIVQMFRPERILEIGTFTGYSALAMALGWETYAPGSSSHPDRENRCILHTIELNEELEDGIRNAIREAGMEDRIVLHIGNALKIIPQLEETWDLVFIDADKPNYLNYYEIVVPRVRPGGFIIADNVLWDGKVLGDPARMDKDTQGICIFNDHVQSDSRVENLLLPVRDGLMVIRKTLKS